MTERIREGLSLPRDVPLELRSSDNAVIDSVNFADRLVRLIVVPYSERATVLFRGRVVEEEVEPGAFDGITAAKTHVTANRDHDHTRVIGRAVEYITDDPRGLIADVRVSQTPLGDETLRLADDGVLRGSIGMLVKDTDQRLLGGLRKIKRAFLDHIAFVPNPAYAGAEVLSVRQAQEAALAESETPTLTPELDRILSDPWYSALLAGQRHK
jgi:HK97 family phage prohead protease